VQAFFPPQIPIRLRSGQAFGCARDDDGEGNATLRTRWLVERTAGPSTSLRFGRDDNSYWGVMGTIDVESEEPNAFNQDIQDLLRACSVVIRPLWQL
jgi:hypothetical protein